MNKKKKEKKSTTIAQAVEELERIQARTLQSFAQDRLLYALKEVNDDTITASSNPIVMRLLYDAILDLIAALGVGDISSGVKVKIEIRGRGTTYRRPKVLSY
ncbi:MAG: hypothetical protein M3275_00735 [Thermoproteota archaeon]|nr:hypothetical protein [Thermoproteota archaeon]MDQ3966903.1 hypothetical protein [Thermoproteota archaeon]